MAGGVLISTGMVTASFARNVVDMYVTIGVISGESSYSRTFQTLCSRLRLPASVALVGGSLAPHDIGIA